MPEPKKYSFDWWTTLLPRGLEQTLTATGALLTSPFRPAPEDTKWWEKFPPISAKEFYPGGRQYEAYEQWKGTAEEPYVPLPIPSGRQLGAYAKPYIEKRYPWAAKFLGTEEWEEPEKFEFGRLGMGDIAELVPWFAAPMARATKKPLEVVTDLITKQLGKGKPIEEAVRIAYKQATKKGKLPKVVAPKAPVKPPAEPPVVVPEGVLTPEESTKVLTDKLATFVKTLKPERAKAELASASIRKQQAARLASIQEALGRGEITGGVAHKRMLAALKGKMPEAKIPVSDVVFSPEEVSALKEIIGASANLPSISVNKYIRLHTMQALDSLLLGKIPTERGLSLLERVFGKPFVQAFRKRASISGVVWEGALEGAGLIKSVRASWDLSALYRQGAPILTARPKQIPSAVKTQIKAVFSDKQALGIHDSLHATKWEGVMEGAGLYRPDFWSSLAKMTVREEAYVSRFARRIPGIKRSERAYVVGLNKIRTDFFIHNAESWARMGVVPSPEDYRHLGRAINILTGRGDVRGLEGALTALNAVLFSPRFQLSRLMTPTLLLDSSLLVRKMAAGVLAKYYGFWATILGAVGLLGYEDISTDANPLSTNFGKIRYKNTWYDPLAGYVPWLRYGARLLSAPIYAIGGAISEKDVDRLYRAKIRTKSTYSDAIREADLARVSETMLRTKLSPALTPVVDWIMGKTLVGREFERMGLTEQLMEYWSPLAIQATYEAMQEEGFIGAGLSLPEYVGFGAYTIPVKDQLVGEVNARTTDYRAARTEYNKLIEDGEWIKADKFALEHPELAYGVVYGQAGSDIRAIEDDIERVEDDKTLSSEEKKERIEELSVQIINIATAVLEQETRRELNMSPAPGTQPVEQPRPQQQAPINPFIGK